MYCYRSQCKDCAMNVGVTVVIKIQTQTTRVSIERKIVLVRVEAVLVRVEAVLVQVKMAEVLTSKYFDDENCIQSVILESELTVVQERSYVYTPGSLFSNVYCIFVEEWREYRFYCPYSAHGRAENNAANKQEM